MNTIGKTLIIAAIAACAAVSAPAYAQDDDSDEVVITGPRGEVKQKSVRYSDLDLRSDRDVKRLDRRVRRASKDVCDWSDNRIPLSEWADQHGCYKTSVSRARSDAGIVVRDAGGREIRFVPGTPYD